MKRELVKYIDCEFLCLFRISGCQDGWYGLTTYETKELTGMRQRRKEYRGGERYEGQERKCNRT